MEKKARKAQANIIAVVLIVLIAIVAVLIVWNVVNPLIKKKGGETGIEKLTTSLEIKEAIFFVTGASKISVYRGTGKGDISSLRFIFYDENGNSDIKEEKTTLAELGTEMYSFSPFSNLGKIKKIAVVPIIGKNLGMESKTEATDIMEIPSGLVSWWRLDDEKDFVGNNHCGSVNIVDSDRGRVANFSSGNPSSCGNDNSLNIENGIGISFWIKTSSGNGEIIKKGENYEVSLEEGKIKFSYIEGGILKNNLSEITLDNNNWRHVAITNLMMYVDGNPVKYLNIGNLDVNSENLYIGGFNGLLDEVMLFNEGLANTEVTGLYNNQKK